MKLTNYEQKALEIIQDYGEETVTILMDDIGKELGLTINQVKGIIGSLVKKRLICEGDVNGEPTLIDMELLL